MHVNSMSHSRTNSRSILPAGLLCMCFLLASCASVPDASRITQATPQLQVNVPQLHVPRAGLMTGGQPEGNAWRDLRAAGVTRVVNLLSASELGSRNEAGEVQASGMDYVQIGVAGPGDLTPENARLLWRSVQGDSGTVLVHCASGNRAGALLALAAVQAGGMSPQAALEFGKAAGLTKLEPVVRERLGLPSLASERSLCAASAPNC